MPLLCGLSNFSDNCQNSKKEELEDFIALNKYFKNTDLCKINEIENPNVKMNEIIGLEEAKEFVKQKIVLPMKFPDLFRGARSAKKGILFFGPSENVKCILYKKEMSFYYFFTF